jgi:hypothetical protein
MGENMNNSKEISSLVLRRRRYFLEDTEKAPYFWRSLDEKGTQKSPTHGGKGTADEVSMYLTYYISLKYHPSENCQK